MTRELLSSLKRAVKPWFLTGVRELSRIRRLLPADGDGINVVGYFHGPFGLGEAARLLADHLEAEGERVHRVLVEKDLSVRRDPMLCPGAGADGPGGTTLLVANPDSLPLVRYHLLGRRCLRARRLIGYWFWEQTLLPPAWKREATAFDEIWVPTFFLQELFRRELPSTPVRRFELPLDLIRARVMPTRIRKEPVPTVFSSYDRTSSYHRKRPDLAYQLFKRARTALGGRGPAPRFLLHHNPYGEPACPDESRFLEEVSGDPGAWIVTGPTSREEFLERMGSCHVLLSTSCAEGYGLTLVEALGLGLTVLTPDWSGIARDRADLFTGLPYTLDVPRIPDHFCYRPEGLWAYVDLEASVPILTRTLTTVSLAP